CYHSGQLRAVLDQFYCSRGKAVELGATNHPTKILDADLLEPAGLHNTGDAERVVTVAFIDLHLEHSLGMASINTDHRYAQPLELAPQPRGCRAAFKPNRPEQTPRSPQDRNQLLLPAQLIPYHSQHRSKSALTIRPAPHNVPLSLSIVPRSHEVDVIPSWRA